MTKLHVPQEEVDNAPEWTGGDFPIPPEGAAIPFRVTGTRDDENEVGRVDRAVYKSGELEGEEYTYLVIDLAWDDENGEPQRHGEFFNLDVDWGIGKLKAFIESLGYAYEEGMDLNTLNGLSFTADVSHVETKKGRITANLKYNTIEVQADAEQSAPAPKAPPRRGGRAPARAPR